MRQIVKMSRVQDDNVSSGFNEKQRSHTKDSISYDTVRSIQMQAYPERSSAEHTLHYTNTTKPPIKVIRKSNK